MTRIQARNIISSMVAVAQEDDSFPIVVAETWFHIKMGGMLVELSSLRKLQWWEQPEVLKTVRAVLGRLPQRWEVKFWGVTIIGTKTYAKRLMTFS
jgi:hypothetical protein